ncbi:MAG: glycosyltransferase [Pseudomonas sp.]|nr:MAG: glycosyltransferase [Pseudomonas sp.]
MGSLLLALAPTVMAAQVYKWVDAQGITHFGAQPPEGASAATVNTNAAPPKASSNFPPPAAAVQPLPPSDDEKQKAADEKVRQEVAQQEAERLKQCDKLRVDVAQLKNNPRIRVDDGNGDLRRITEEERQERIAASEKSIRENCN